jgi:hypothetical protein
MRKSVSIFILAAVAALSGCGDDENCGPGEAAADGIQIEVDGQTLSYGNFTSSPNNDCPDPGGGPTALTIEGEQVFPATSATFHLTFCLPSPDDIGESPIALSGDDRVQVIDVSGEIDGCRVFRDASQTPSGTIAFIGYCDDGLHPGGYALELSGSVPALRACAIDAGTGQDSVTLDVSGRAAIDAINL